jgi:hypothetical protein
MSRKTKAPKGDAVTRRSFVASLTTSAAAVPFAAALAADRPATNGETSSAAAPAVESLTPPGIPPLLATVARALELHHNPEDLARALASARTFAQASLDVDPESVIEEFIEQEATRGPWARLHSAIADAPDSEDVFGTGHSAGDLVNLYSEPAVLIGMALAYVILANDTGNGGAR